MAHYGTHPKLTRSTEPIDTSVWHWFVCNGPHGERFTWHREHGMRDIDLLAKVIDERETANTGFREKSRLTALESLQGDDPILILTAIQVLTIVGSDEDIRSLKSFLSHADARIPANVRSASFERGIKVN